MLVVGVNHILAVSSLRFKVDAGCPHPSLPIARLRGCSTASLSSHGPRRTDVQTRSCASRLLRKAISRPSRSHKAIRQRVGAPSQLSPFSPYHKPSLLSDPCCLWRLLHEEMASTLLHWPILSYICETFFFGIYTALFVFSTAFLLLKRRCTRTRNLVLAASVVMYVVSATHWAISIALLARATRDGSVVGIVMTPIERLITSYLPSISSILGDAIVVWRAWVLWERRRNLFIPPVLFLLATIATSAAGAVLTFKSASSGRWQEVDIDDTLGYTTFSLTILINLWATSLIWIKAWQHRRFIRSLMGKSTPRTRVEKALTFIIESGALYLCIWVTYIVIHVTCPGASFIWHAIVVQLIGIYPTVIVAVVTMRLGTADVLSQPGHSGWPPASPLPIVFAPQPLQSESLDGSTSDTDDMTLPCLQGCSSLHNVTGAQCRHDG
ncbi:hypothetical protein BC834DRAFT_461591 [Gloeopeniophorella convolvens]|nr:hypothetical protein BC834DRAFT_461591 [Gloeopeniophorella convolvens]